MMACNVMEEDVPCEHSYYKTHPLTFKMHSIQALFTYLEKIHQTVGGFIELDDGMPKCIFLQDALMKDVFNFYPDRVCINCAFSKFEIDLFTIFFLCEDSNGRSMLIGVGFCQEMDVNSVRWVLTSFKKHNPNWKKISSLDVDPKLEHWDHIKECFPGSIIMISAYHSIRAFENYVFNAAELQNMLEHIKQVAVDLFKDLVYAPNSSEFEARLQKYYALPKPLVSYLENFWSPKNSWRIMLDFANEDVFKERHLYLNELNFAVEMLSNEEERYATFIKKLFLIILLNRRQKPTVYLQPKTYLYSRYSPEYEVCKTLTPYAAKFVVKQLHLSEDRQISSVPLSDIYAFDHLGLNVKASAYACECNFYTYMRLPCRHIFSVRKANNLVLFDGSNVGYIWNTQYYNHASACILDFCSNSTDNRIPGDLASRTTLASHLIEITAPLLLDADQIMYESRMEVLKDLNKSWKMGCDASVKFVAMEKSSNKNRPATFQDLVQSKKKTGSPADKESLAATNKSTPAIFKDPVQSKRKTASPVDKESFAASTQNCTTVSDPVQVKRKTDTPSVEETLAEIGMLHDDENVPSVSGGTFENNTFQENQSSDIVDCASNNKFLKLFVVPHEPKRASRQRQCDINHYLLNGKHINLAYIVNRICSTKESCVNWLKSQGFLSTSMKCTSCQREMISKNLSRLNDGVAWRCLERKCLGKKSSARLGTWFVESNLTLQQILIFTYMWLNKFSKTRILVEMSISANSYIKWDKFNSRVCEESLNDNSSIMAQTGPSNYKDIVDRWLQNHTGKDTFLEFLKDAAKVYRKNKEKISFDGKDQ